MSSTTTRTRTDEGRGGLGSKLSGLAVALGCVLFLGGFVWGAILYQPYTVPTDSMSPTIVAGDRVLGQRIDGSEIKRGDVVVFRQASWGDMALVKRVVAVGGDTIACCTNGKLTVNGKQIQESYLRKGQAAELVGIPSIKVPEGRLFLLGDERTGSLDSTAHLTEAFNGTVSRSGVEARVDAVVWPMKGMLPRPTGFEPLGALSTPGPLRLLTVAVVVGGVLVLGGGAYGPIAGRLAKRRAVAVAEPAGAR
ncbi:signal peptidase I [Streptomyces sp. ME02-8801-2C]|uniref:signal peptidase I n=1 Tax=Streptomyces sp. ME02-8801-2C TaxID=3028680 RepID=UPI0029A47560|nr:signal peptidase I [Streptomyces sp. ME02-8801-2C]MDX3456022.1 signal peptidase I [Streptomyces sp. ME02-8801-2C]